MCILFCSHSEIGSGWAPVLISSGTEFKFIRENQHYLTDGRDFFIGGSTNAAGGGNIEYYEYQTTSAGNRPYKNFITLLAIVDRYGVTINQ